MNRIIPTIITALVLARASAADWPQWRGPGRDSESAEAVAPWGKDGPPVKWKVAFGEGHSSPVVADGKVFVLYKAVNHEAVCALDAKTGEPQWVFKYPAPFVNQFGSGPRSTPTVDGKRLYTLGATGLLHCLSADDGKVIWSSDTFKEFKATNLFFGVSTSPMVDGDRLLVNVGGTDGASVVAFDKATGKVVWKAGTDRASYASPQIIGTGAARQAVFVTFREVLSLNPENGEVLWKVPLKTRNDENAVTPLAFGDMVIVSSVSGGLMGLRPVVKDGKPAVETVWHQRGINCYFSSPVIIGGNVYAVHGAPAQLSCLDAATGKGHWTHPAEVGLLKPGVGLLHGSLIDAGGKLLMLSDIGKLTLIEPGAEGYKEIAAAKVCGSTWVHPALADGLLYVKDPSGLICLDLGKK